MCGARNSDNSATPGNSKDPGDGQQSPTRGNHWGFFLFWLGIRTGSCRANDGRYSWAYRWAKLIEEGHSVWNQRVIWLKALSECMIQSNYRFGPLLRRQICLNTVWHGGLWPVASLALSLDPVEPRCARRHSPTAKLDSTTPRRTKPAGLIESWSVMG